MPSFYSRGSSKSRGFKTQCQYKCCRHHCVYSHHRIVL